MMQHGLARLLLKYYTGLHYKGGYNRALCISYIDKDKQHLPTYLSLPRCNNPVMWEKLA